MAALCLALVGTVRSADTPYGAKPGAEPESQPQTKSAEGSLARYNKATGIVGMDVRNHKDERLGEIKDVVFDLNSERVAYAVLATGGIPARQKYLPVPLNAFTPGPDNKYLILRAEKSKVETAMGFERDNWPSVNNPSWGAEPFWEKGTAQPGNIEKPSTPLDLPPKPDTQPEIK